jgi:hypothetical protein
MNEFTLAMGNWVFDFGNWLSLSLSIILLISLLLTLRLVRRRLYHRNRLRALFVMAMNIIAFAVIFLLVTDPRREFLREQAVVLVTDGGGLDSEKPAKNNKIYVAPGSASSLQPLLPELKNANWLLHIGQLPLREPALSALDIRGYGLKVDQWQNLSGDLRLEFNPPPNNGFIEMSWSRHLVAGEPLAVSGRFNDDARSVIHLRLLDPADNLVNESRIRSDDWFRIVARPKSKGSLSYKLQAWDGGLLLAEEPVNLDVGTSTPVRIMIYQSAPSYETRQLKNFASTQGAEVLIHTRISKDRFINQTANITRDTETAISPRTLANQDIVIMDGRMLTSLEDLQLQWLNDAIEQGLGVLILADTSLLESFTRFSTNLLRGFNLQYNANARPATVPQLPDNVTISPELALPVARMNLQANHTGTEVLLDDGAGRILVAQHGQGFGRVAISLVNQSHRLLTSGHRAAWSDYWMALISAVARPGNNSFLIPSPDTSFYSPGEGTPVCAMSSTGPLSVMITPPANETGQAPFELSLVKDKAGSPRRCAWFWPQSSGWHHIDLRSEDEKQIVDQHSVYITAPAQWLAQKRYERIVATRSRLASHEYIAEERTGGKLVSEALNNAWLWTLLVIFASLLWLERKLDYGD